MDEITYRPLDNAEKSILEERKKIFYAIDNILNRDIQMYHHEKMEHNPNLNKNKSVPRSKLNSTLAMYDAAITASIDALTDLRPSTPQGEIICPHCDIKGQAPYNINTIKGFKLYKCQSCDGNYKKPIDNGLEYVDTDD